ncbi:hypothetical protein LTR28_012660 [Elasticomyces elasticus]|nr:hypothetical protein LTR28_012660 [Elasticomyces elasticus]
MLRPATPLSILFFIAFVLLLLSTLSTPVIKAIPLANFQGVNFGVFGYCKADTCSGIRVGYTTDGLFSNSANSPAFSLPASARHSLASILIIHPVAAFLTLICFGLAVAAHFHAPAHSPRYLLALLVLTFPTLLVVLLAFLVDILLFFPHMAWGGWIVLAAVIIISASGVVTCAMRRTLVSRKARKKRIEENAEMNGQNYYEGLNQTRLMADELPKADSPPPLSGSTQVNSNSNGVDKLPHFATFEMKDRERRSMDDQTPLNPRNPSVRSTSTGGAGRQPMGMGAPEEDMPPMPSGAMDRRPSRDQYGNIISPGVMAMGMTGDLPPPGLRRQNSNGTLDSNGSNRSRGPGGPPPTYGRGRGGYPPRGGGYGPPRGGYGPRGGPVGGYRGGPQGMRGPPPQGWNGPPQGWNGPPPQSWNGPPPQGWNGAPGAPPGSGPQGRGMGPGAFSTAGVGAAMAGGAMMGRGQRGPSPYRQDNYYGGERGMSPGPRQRQGPEPYQGRNSPAPGIQDPAIGQAIEMDERTGSPGHASPQFGAAHDDGDMMGMGGLQQQRREMSPTRADEHSGEGLVSPASVHSNDTYIPPRAAWAQQPHSISPIDSYSNPKPKSNVIPPSNTLPLSPIQASPTSPIAHQPPHGHVRTGSEAYYEDVDPQFATQDDVPLLNQTTHHPVPEDRDLDQHTALPTSLIPGPPPPTHQGAHNQPNPHHLHPTAYAPHHHHHRPNQLTNGTRNDNNNSSSTLGPSSSYENIAEGARSPAGSDASHFTSVSQRGVNPNWRPGGPPGSYGGPPAFSAPPQPRRRDDVILNANPDFSLPGARAGRGGAFRGGRGGGGMGLTPPGRYPSER